MRIAILACAALLVLAGCQKDERADAARLTKALTDLQAGATAALTIENEMLNRARPWCAGMTAAGTGHDTELDENTATAADLARQARAANGRWESIRQTLLAQRLRAEVPRNIRAALTAQISKHQAALEQLRAALDDTAAQFKTFAQDRAYTGDTVPPVVTKLDHILGSHDPPTDDVAAALSDLHAKYGG
jgi:type VI protein secretion system component VasK